MDYELICVEDTLDFCKFHKGLDCDTLTHVK